MLNKKKYNSFVSRKRQKRAKSKKNTQGRYFSKHVCYSLITNEKFPLNFMLKILRKRIS